MGEWIAELIAIGDQGGGDGLDMELSIVILLLRSFSLIIFRCHAMYMIAQEILRCRSSWEALIRLSTAFKASGYRIMWSRDKGNLTALRTPFVR